MILPLDFGILRFHGILKIEGKKLEPPGSKCAPLSDPSNSVCAPVVRWASRGGQYDPHANDWFEDMQDAWIGVILLPPAFHFHDLPFFTVLFHLFHDLCIFFDVHHFPCLFFWAIRELIRRRTFQASTFTTPAWAIGRNCISAPHPGESSAAPRRASAPIRPVTSATTATVVVPLQQKGVEQIPTASAASLQRRL